MTIATLPALLAELPVDLRAAAARIFQVHSAVGRARVPPELAGWTAAQFGSVAAVEAQPIVTVTNRLTLEAASYGPLRALRPAQTSGGDAALEAQIAAALAQPHAFSDPDHQTTADVFGRIRGQHCTTAANIAKFTAWHGVIIFNAPHPLRITQVQLLDYLETGWRWFQTAHGHDRSAIYPLLGWNCLPKSGATIVHGHMQLALGQGAPFARSELWRQAAERYRAETGKEYLADLAAIHAALGLELPAAAGWRAFAHLTPLRNREAVVLGPGDDLAGLAQTLFGLLRPLIDRHGLRSFNLAVTWPPLLPDGLDWRDVPLVARFGDRGDPLAHSGDLGFTELYATGSITADPFAFAAALRN